MIFTQLLFDFCLEKIYNFHLNRNIKQQSPYALKLPEMFLWTKSTNAFLLFFFPLQISALLDTRAARNDRSYQALTTRGRTIEYITKVQ